MSKKQYFSDFYGNTASITKTDGGAKLICRDYYGRIIKRSIYSTVRGAKVALGRFSDCWHTTRGYIAD